MKAILATLILSLLVTNANAVEFKNKKRNTANALYYTETELLNNLFTCTQTKKSADELRTCADEFLSKKISSKNKNEILFWLSRPLFLDSLSECPTFIKKWESKKELTNPSFLCSKIVSSELNKIAVFYFDKNGASLTLLEIKEKLDFNN